LAAATRFSGLLATRVGNILVRPLMVNYNWRLDLPVRSLDGFRTVDLFD
jgi:hypothetical protein